MIHRLLFTVLSSYGALAAGGCGDIQGKVSGVSGTSVVYVDTIPGKTFPPPSQHFKLDQKGLDVPAPCSGGTGRRDG